LTNNNPKVSINILITLDEFLSLVYSHYQRLSLAGS
jgi:hypothetical protein